MSNPFDNLTLHVHFDYKLVGEMLYTGFTCVEDGDIVHSGMNEINISSRLKADLERSRVDSNYKPTNNYHYTLTSLFYCLKELKQFLMENTEYSNVVYRNQNSYFFDWVTGQKICTEQSYLKIINNVRAELNSIRELIPRNISHSYSKIPKDKNEAKKALTKRVSVIKNTEETVREINLDAFDFSQPLGMPKKEKKQRKNNYQYYNKNKQHISHTNNSNIQIPAGFIDMIE